MSSFVISGCMWRLLSNFLRVTQSQVRSGASPSAPWTDTGVAQGKVLSPLLFNLLVNGLAASVRSPDQLYADDLVVTAECQHDLQVSLDAVSAWGHQWRFSFGIGPTKSAVMVFGSRRSVPPCSAFLRGQELPLVSEYPYLCVILTPSLSWTALAWQLLVRSVRSLVQVRTSPAAVRVYSLHVLCAAEHILGSGISRFISARFAGD